MRYSIIYCALLAALFLSFTACDDDPGIEIIELKLETLPFDRITLETSSDVRIIQSDAFEVVIRGKENEVNDVQVGVINERLSIEDHAFSGADLTIQVFVPEIRELESHGSSLVYGESNFTQSTNMDISLSGSGEIDFAVFTDDLDVELNGSGYVYLEGDVHTLDAEVSGSGWLRSFELLTTLTDVRIESSGSAEVSVANDLDVFLLGSGDVYFKGHPSISADITGSGSVIDAN